MKNGAAEKKPERSVHGGRVNVFPTGSPVMRTYLNLLVTDESQLNATLVCPFFRDWMVKPGKGGARLFGPRLCEPATTRPDADERHLLR